MPLTKLIRKVFAGFYEVLLWLILVGAAVGGVYVGKEFGGFVFTSMAGGTGNGGIMAMVIGGVAGLLIGFILDVMIGGFIATILSIDKQLERIGHQFERIGRRQRSAE